MTFLTLDSITDARLDASGRVVISGSHGGIYPATVASNVGLRAVAFNDAGIGLDDAGIAGLAALETVGMAAIAADCGTCRIGDANDAINRGLVSAANRVAGMVGITTSMPISTAMDLLERALVPHGKLPKALEARRTAQLGNGRPVELLDSASLVEPSDEGKVVVTGSHGGLIGGDPARALKARARIAVFNDAGVGIEEFGITRLPALDERGVAAVTVSAGTARIGDAASALETGVISYANRRAMELGATVGRQLSEWLADLPASQ